MATLRGKNPKYSKKLNFTAIRSNKLVHIFAVLLIAGVGSYLVVASRAADPRDSYQSPGTVWGVDNGLDTEVGGDGVLAPPGSTIDGKLYINADRWGGDNPSPRSSTYVFLTYDTRLAKFISSTCVWKYGCTAKQGDDLHVTSQANVHGFVQYNDSESDLHTAQVLLCFTIPSGYLNTEDELAATYKFKRTATTTTWGRGLSWLVGKGGSRQGDCEANPNLKDIWLHGGNVVGYGGWCEHYGPDVDGGDCDFGKGPGAGPGTLTGFGNGGNGNGGEGSGNNGVGPGPGAGSSGGGGGSSANRQADKPNSLPSPSAQGENEQTELDPDPFFDGKDFERGSATDNLVFGSSTIGGKKVPRILLYLLSATLLGGAGGGLYWRWKKQRR